MPTVDNKIVQMTFKNEQFERGVKESLHSLEELKKALNLDKSAESLSNLEKIASSFDISGIAKGVDDIASHFTLLGNIGQEIFHRISRTAVDTMQNVVNTVASMPNAGMSKYEQKNKSVQMIKSAMPDKSIEEIERVLARLNEYTDLTSYDFSTMANSIGKFVSAGVDLDVAEKVMEGIANETASAGGEISAANIAMYNFSQALAAGSVKLMDWRSIQNQNLDTKEFKEEIIQTAIAMGKLGKVSDKVGYYVKGSGKNMRQVEVDYKSFANTLSDGWFDSDVMIEVFQKYADRESEVGKKGFEAAKVAITLTQAFDAVKDAISTGWMTSFSYLFGNLEEAGDLFTRVSDAIIGLVEPIYTARNELLKGWHFGGEDGISGYTTMIEGFSNAWSTLLGFVEAAKTAFKDVFGVLESSDLINITKAFSDFTGKLKEMFGISEETVEVSRQFEKAYDPMEKWTHALKKGMSGKEIKTLQWRLIQLKDTELGMDKSAADGIFGPRTEAALKKFQEKVGLAQTGIYDQATRDALSKKLFPGKHTYTVFEDSTETVQRYGTYLNVVKSALEGIFSVAKSVTDVIGAGLEVAEKVIKIFEPIGKGVIVFAAGLGKIITYVSELTTSFLTNESAMKKFDTFLKPISDVIGIIGSNIETVGQGLALFAHLLGAYSFEDAATYFRGAAKFDGRPFTKFALGLYNIIAKIREIVKNATPAFENLKNTIGNVLTVLGNLTIGGILTGLDAIGTFFTNIITFISESDILTKVLDGISTALQVVVTLAAGAGYGLYTLVTAIVNGGAALLDFVRNSEFFQNALSAIDRFTRPIGEFFGSVFESIASIAGKIGNFKTFGDAFRAFLIAMNNNPVGKRFVPAILTAVKAIGEFVSKIRNLPNIIKNAIEKVPSIFQSAVGNVRGFLGNLVSEAKEFGQKIWNAIGNFFTMDTSKIEGLPQKLLARLQALGPVIDWVKGKFNSIKEFLMNPGKLFDNFISTLKGTVGNAKTSVGGFFDDLFPNLSVFGQKIGSAIGNMFSIDLSGIKEIPQKLMNSFQAFNPVIEWIKTKFNTLTDFLMDPNKLLSHVVGALKGIGEFVINIFKNFNLGTIWDTAKTALGTYIMLTFANSLKDFSKSVGVLTGAIDKDDKDGFAGKLRHIAVTIAIVTAALAGLALIPAEDALNGVIVMGIALGAVVGAIIALNKWAPKTEGIGKGILSMALSIGAVLLAVAGAVALVNSGADLTKPLLLIAGIITALGVVAWAMNKFGSKGKKGYSSGMAKTILAMCAGLYLIVKAVGEMSKIIKENGIDKNGVSHQGRTMGALGAIVVMLAGLGTIAVLMSHFGGKGTGGSATGIASTILAICNSLGTIVSAVGKMMQLIKQYPEDWGWGVGIVEGLLITVGAIAVLLAKYSNDMKVSTSIASVAPIVAMGIFLDTVIYFMGEAIQKVSGVDPAVIVTFLLGVAGAVGAMIATVSVFSAIPIQNLLTAAVGIVAVLSAIGVGIDIAATFTADAVEKMATAIWLVGQRMRSFSEFIADVDTSKIEQVMNSMVSTILPAIGSMVLYSGAVTEALTVAGNIWLIGEAFSLFQESISGITTDTGSAIKKLPEDIKATVDGINAIEGINDAKEVLTNLGGALSLYYGNLAQMNSETPTDENGNFDINKANEAFGNLAELTLDDDTLNKIKSYATGGDHDLNNFAIGIENLATALKTYGEKISTLDKDQVETANGVLDKVLDIDQHLNPMTDVNFDVLKGKRTSISAFGLDVAALGRALKRYGNSVSDLNPAKIFMANIVIDAVSTLANNLPTTGGLWQMLTGEQKLGEFAANMDALGTGMANYANQVSGADFTNVDASTLAVKGLAEAQSILQSYGGLKSLLEGTAGLDKLGENLVGLGESLTEFAKAEGGIKTLKDADFENLNKIMEPIKALAEAQSIMQRVGGFGETFSGEINWSNLTAGLDQEFINKLNEFNEMAKGFNANDEHLMSVLDFLERLAFIQALSVSGVKGFDDLGHGFDSLMNFIIRELGSDGNENTITNIQKNLENLFSAIGNEQSQSNMAGAVGVAASAIETAVDEQVINPATTWGEDLVTNFATGMENKISAAEQAAIKIANVIWSYLHFTVPEKGPLKDADTWGGDFLTTWLGGLIAEQPTAEEAVSNTGSVIANAWNSFIDTAKNGGEGLMNTITNAATAAQEKLGSLIGTDGNPVISPILDLTNIESGVSDLNGMLSGQSVSVGTDLAKNVMSGNGVTIVQGGAAEDHSPEIIAAINELGDRIVALETQMASNMTNLKVVMNTNALVGQIAPTMDKVLGGYANRR